jgi:cytochrome c biogenesis protein
MVSFVGVVIPQGSPVEFYLIRWGKWGNLIIITGLNRIFSTQWFYLLLEILSLNVLVCSFKRLLKNIKNARVKKFWSSADKLATFKFNHSFSTILDMTKLESLISAFLKNHFYSISIQSTQKGIQIYSRKGLFKAYGSFFFHIGIVILFLGGMYGKMKGNTYIQQFSKNDTKSVENRDFLVRCDWFKIEKNENGMIKDYKSKLVLLRPDSSVITEKIIEVNSPLSYKGIRFYQSSYTTDPERVKNILLHLSGPGFAHQGVIDTFEFAEEIAFPNSELRLFIGPYVPDFVIDRETKTVMTRSNQPYNPAMKVTVYSSSDTLFNRWLFARFPTQHPSVTKYDVKLIDFTPEYSTGIQVRDNPGVPIIWISIIIMTIGIMATFYFSKEKIWIFIESEEIRKKSIYIGAKLGEDFDSAQIKFKKICHKLEKDITGVLYSDGF